MLKLVHRFLDGFYFSGNFPAEGAAAPAADGASSAAGAATTPPPAAGAATAAATPPAAGAATTPPPAGNAADVFAAAVLAAVGSRTERAEKSVVKSMAEQYGLSEEEATAIFEKARDEKKKSLPPEQQKQIDDAISAANGRLIAAEVKTLSVDMKIIDPDAALTLMDRTKIKVDDKGVVTGAKEALEALIKAKPYLVSSTKPAGAWGGVQGAGTGGGLSARDELRNAMLGPSKT